MSSAPARETVSDYREVANATRCRDCGTAAALRESLSDNRFYCVACARKAMPFAPRSLLQALGGRAVILPDLPRERREKGLIIIPAAFRDRVGKLRDEIVFTGVVVGVGPGWFARMGPAGKWLGTNKVGKRQEMPCEMWDHVLVHCKYEVAITMWRGLAIAGAASIMAAYDKEGAAQ